MSENTLKVALVHDALTRRGGAEVVLEELLRLFPAAEIYALYAGDPRMIVDGRLYNLYTSFLQRFPRWFRYHTRRLLPLLPQAAEQFDLSFYDVVISSTSGFAKGVVTRVAVPHICYCHTPTRYLWNDTHEILARHSFLVRWPVRISLHYLRLADHAAAQRVDIFVANSNYTALRIKKYYHRDSIVVYPPIDTAFYTPPTSFTKAHDPYFLCVGRLTPSKYFDQAVRVCAKLDFPLVIVGTGPHLLRLKELAGSSIRFLGRVSRHELRELYRNARAFLQPGAEDFGMASAEALSCGTPVIAYGRGGVCEIVQPGITGVLYAERNEEALAEALRQFLSYGNAWRKENLQSSVLKFSRSRFYDGMRGIVKSALP